MARRLVGGFAVLLATIALAGMGTLAGAGPAAAQTGSLLVDETFAGTSAADANFVPLGDACLTAATTAPPAGHSTLGVCSSRTQSPPATTPGFLQLTDARTNRTGAVLYNRALPANGGIDITFEQYQYGGSGADGIGFFLVDGAAELTATGAEGGSLGYAQKTNIPGVHAGFLGVGLDGYGNFSNDTEGRGTGCPTPSPFTGLHPDAVVLRGPGEGLIGYCFLTANTSLPGSLRSTTATGANPAPAKRTVHIRVTPGATPTVTVDIDFANGAGFQTVLTHTLSTPLPPTFKFGLSGSTGGSTDVHLIRELSVTSLEPLPEINLIKQVAITTPPQPPAYVLGATVPYQFVVTNTGADTLQNVLVSDPAIADLNCPSTTLGPAGSPTATMICTGTHVITAEEIQHPTFSNTATVTAVNSLGTQLSDDDTATVDLASTPELTKEAVDPVVIAGNPVGFKITLFNPGPPSPLSGLTLTDPLPAAPGVNWTIAHQYGPATCTINGTPPSQTLDCGTFTLQVGERQFVQVASATLPSTPCVTLHNMATSGSPVTGTRHASDDVIVDCRGSLTVTKTITGPAAGRQGEVTVRVNCGGTDLPDFVIPAGATGTHSKTYTGLTAGQQCVVSEIHDGATAMVIATITGDDQQMVIGPGTTAILALTDRYDFAPGSLTVSKLIGGPASGRQGQVIVHVACTRGTTSTFSGAFPIAAGSAAGRYTHTFDNIPAGSTCTVTEPTDGATTAVTVTTTGVPQTVRVPAAGAEHASTITDIYRFVPGSLRVTKTIAGSAAGQQGEVVIHTVCNGTPLSPDLFIAAGRTTPQSHTYPGIPAGQRCTVTETQDGATDAVQVTTTGNGQTVRVPAGGTAHAELTDTYTPRPPGTLQVTKVVTGPAAGAQGRVVIHSVCNGTALSPDLVVPAGSDPGDYSHTYTDVPAAASCTVTETADGASPMVTVATTGSPQTVTVPTGAGASAAVIDTYDYVSGTLTVSKTIAGPAAGRQGAVVLGVVCDGTALPDFTVPAGAGTGTTSHTYRDVPGNSACTVTENADGSTPTVTATITGDDGRTVTVPPAGAAHAAIADTYEPIGGALDVDKLIAGPAGGRQGPITIRVACTIDGSTTFTGTAHIGAEAVGSIRHRFDDIPSSSVCTITEPINGATNAITATVEGSPHTVTIPPNESALGSLTNSYDFKPGALTVTKTISGPAAGRQDTITIHTECNGHPVLPDLRIPAGTPAGTISHAYSDLPGQALCMSSEQLDGSTEAVTVTILSDRQFRTVEPAGTTFAALADAYHPARLVSGPGLAATGPRVSLQPLLTIAAAAIVTGLLLTIAARRREP
jgi:uncharacterized repeat protein (TIGR01451 family)